MVAESPRLSRIGLPAAPGALEQRVVLHVARADLNDVRDLEPPASIPSASIASVTIRSPVSSRACASSSQPRLSQPLERVGRAARLEGAGPEHRGAGFAHGPGGLENLALALHRAGARHDHDLVASDREPAGEPDDGGLRLPLAGDLLVRLGDVDDLLDAGECGEPGAVDPPIVADQARPWCAACRAWAAPGSPSPRWSRRRAGSPLRPRRGA